jgi:hypothetical protein
VLLWPRPRTHQKDGTIREAEASSQGAREEVHLIKSAVLAFLAVQRNRDDQVRGQKLCVAPDQLKELRSEKSTERFEAFVLEEDDGVG